VRDLAFLELFEGRFNKFHGVRVERNGGGRHWLSDLYKREDSRRISHPPSLMLCGRKLMSEVIESFISPCRLPTNLAVIPLGG
jgi:hypothetical protein